ncbi:LLM class flavin-dependent oxidoreductase [Streptomyces clavuligerus]|uniref:LLM class flavin-dependent oxidoreductase n=3 Tax=Streptomyces clavuligerus TaxID=1901 RepID=UPI00020D93C5|nr:LLM class flavin-dependent oxidoreductase [Streptomyces clavuligerus]WDN57294.1 LLM class flavin-dependent oxidoreductase [Streptomyces clavuligerus]
MVPVAGAAAPGAASAVRGTAAPSAEALVPGTGTGTATPAPGTGTGGTGRATTAAAALPASACLSVSPSGAVSEAVSGAGAGAGDTAPGRGRVSVLFPHQIHDLTELTALAALVRDGAADRLWLGQSLAVESHHALAWLAGAGYRVPVGLSVALTALRHPYDAAAQARSLALLTGHAPVIGYGAGRPGFVRALHGHPYERPAAAVAEYLGAVRALLHGDPAAHRPELFPLGADLPAAPAAPLPELAAGVLRPGMAKAAARTADTAVGWMTPAPYVRDVLIPALDEGARTACRPRPRMVTVTHAAVARRGRSPLILAQRGAAAHLAAPHYAAMLRRAGLAVDASDPVAGARELVEEGVFLYGDPAELADRIRDCFAAGVDEVVLNPAGTAWTHGFAAALDDLRDITEALGTPHG